MNWHQRIDAAEKRGGFTKEDERDSGCWVTCACGEQDKRIPRGLGSAPKDDSLRIAGNHFDGHVLDGNFAAARTTLAVIEKRAAEALAEVDHDRR